MALTKVRAPRARDDAQPERRNVLGSWWVLGAAALVLFVAFGWSFLNDPSLPAPTRDPAWYTWRAELLQHAAPANIVKDWGPFHLFSGGYRVTTPVAGALLMQVAGMSKFTWTALVMVALPVLTALALGAFALRHRKDPLVFLLTALATAALFLTTPFVGYMDNVTCLYLLALALPFLEPARTSWGARSAIFLFLFLAALTHPTTLAVFVLVLGAVAGWHFLTSRFRLVQTIREDGPMLVAAGLGGAAGLAMWKVGMWGRKAPFSDAALPPPYPAEFFRQRLHEWVTSMHPAIVVPFVVVALVAIAVASFRRKERADHYSLVSVLWLAPLVALLGYVAGLTYPYYRFLNSTLAVMLLVGMGAWIVARLGLRYLKAAGVLVVALVVAALGFMLAQGLSSWNKPDAAERWLQPDTRVALASMEAYVAPQATDRPIVFVANYQDNQKAYGWAKTYSNTARAGLEGDQALRSYVYFGSVDDYLAGRPTSGHDPTYTRVSLRYFQETDRGLHGSRADPVVVMLRPFNQEPGNFEAMKRFTVITPGTCPATPDGCESVVVTGAGAAPVDRAAVQAARQAGGAELAALRQVPGVVDDPGHLLRVIGGLLLLVVVPGAIASGWFELRTAADRLALVPGSSIALCMFSAIVVLAVRRGPFGPAEAVASVGLAIAIAAVLAVLARRRRAGRAIVVPFTQRALSLFSNRDFGFLMGAVFLAVLGDGIVQGALAKTIAFGGKAGFSLDEAHSARHILALVLLTYLPYTFISPFMGVLIDRFDRRKLLVIANGVRAVVVVVVGLALLGGHLADPILIGALLLTLASTRLVLAIKSAGIPTVLGRRDLMQGNSISQAGSAVFQIVGAAIALVGTKAVSAGVVVIAGACVYAVGAMFGARTRNLEEDKPTARLAQEVRRMLRDIRDGIGQVRQRAAAKLGLFSFLTLRALVSFVALVFALEVREILGGHSNKKALLVAAAAAALGAGIGFVAAQLLKDRTPPARLIVGSMVVAGVGTVAFGGVTRLIGLSVVAFVAALAYFLGKISADTIMQQSLPDQYRGRGFSLFDVAYNLAWIVPALVLFALWSTGRARILVIGTGVLFLAAAALVAAWARRIGPELRHPGRAPADRRDVIDVPDAAGGGDGAGGGAGTAPGAGEPEQVQTRD